MLIDFSADLYKQFGDRMSHTLISDLGYSRPEASSLTGTVVELLVEKGTSGYSDVHDFLVSQGVQNRWNGVFYHCRAPALAQWVLPHVRGSLIDVLCGSGRIGGILSDMGVATSLSERGSVRDSYPMVQTGITWLDHDSLTEESEPAKYGTVLLSTALHHEPDPVQLLEFGLKLASERLIIVENCVEADLTEDMHIFVDDFFNYCLNKTPLPCPAQHHTVDEWTDMLKGRAKLVFSDRRSSLPGIPLSHHLLVAEILH